MEIIKQVHVLSVHKVMELPGAMMTVNGLMDNVFQKRTHQQVLELQDHLLQIF